MKKDKITEKKGKLQSSEKLEFGQKADMGRTPTQRYSGNYSKVAPETVEDPFEFF